MTQGRRPRVLIVDDQPEIARSLARLLVASAEVTTASSGAEALALFVQGERFELILCDVMMPGMTGIELFDRLLAIEPEIAPIFVFTTGGVAVEYQRALDATGARCLNKPCDIDEIKTLLETVRRDG